VKAETHSLEELSHVISAFLTAMQSLLLETQVLLGRNHTNGVGVAHTTTPTLDAHHAVTLVQDTKLDGLADAPLQATVDILLPVDTTEIWLRLREMEWIHTAVQV
jgi:hypothetical protein